MAESNIEWTGHTWNPVVGCSVVSPGCTNCYAMKMAARLERMGVERYVGLTKPSKAGAVWTGEMRLVDDALTLPLRRKKPTTYFVNSMSDLFHENVPDAWIDRVFAVMALAPQHTFQVLTKRSARMRAYFTNPPRVVPPGMHDPRNSRVHVIYGLLSGIGSTELGQQSKFVAERMDALWYSNRRGGGWPLPNVWLGVSAEDQTRADERIPDLLATPAAIRFVSAEPLLGPMNLAPHLRPTGYTLGNPDAYEPGLFGGVLEKGVGGAFFKTAEAAASALENGQLPRSWFPDRNLPGRVYELRGTQHDGSRDSVGAARLTKPARITSVGAPSLDWIIVGGESGPNARPMHPQWARDIRDQCAEARVPFFFKQWGEWAEADAAHIVEHGPVANQRGDVADWLDQTVTFANGGSARLRAHSFTPHATDLVFHVGKKAAGRFLDGVEHNGMPTPASSPLDVGVA